MQRGGFSLAAPKEAVVDVRVEMRGYAPFMHRVERDGRPVAIALRKIDMVKGSVTAGGKPVAKALVMLGDDYVTLRRAGAATRRRRVTRGCGDGTRNH